MPDSLACETRSVLVVDDDATVLDVVTRYLHEAGFEVHQARTGPEAMASIATHEPELIVLDLMLPGFDGYEVFRRLRAERTTPVVMLTALGEQADRLVGLEMGADDYLAKPFSVRELAARCQNVLRRSTPAGPSDAAAIIDAGDLHLDERSRRVLRGEQDLQLTVLEFDLLAFLMANEGQAFTREELLEKVWGYSVGDTATVTVHIRRVREKIEDDSAAPTRISTVWGYGYRFDG